MVSGKIVKCALRTLRLGLRRVHPRGFPEVVREFLIRKTSFVPLCAMQVPSTRHPHVPRTLCTSGFLEGKSVGCVIVWLCLSLRNCTARNVSFVFVRFFINTQLGIFRLFSARTVTWSWKNAIQGMLLAQILFSLSDDWDQLLWICPLYFPCSASSPSMPSRSDLKCR